MKRVLLLCAIFATFAFAVKADTNQPQQTLNPGWILVAPLVDFAPAGQQKYYNLLQNGHYAEAASGLKQTLAQNKNDLVAFVGLAQADPSSWPSAVTQLESMLKAHEGFDTEFKLGTLYFYEWKTNPSRHSKDILRAQQLLARAWKRYKTPIVGLIYAEVYEASSPNLARMSSTLDQIIADLAGPNAKRYYEQAQASGWNWETPPIQQTPPANLRPLRGVLKLAWSLSNVRVGHGVMEGNNIKMVYDPVPVEQQRKAVYLLEWRSAVDQSLSKH